MRDYRNNYKWLLWFAPFRALSISAAYLTPFFLEKGFSTSKIFLLQSVFSLAYVVWEIPSGWVSDKIGRSRTIQASVPIAAISMVLYGLSDHFWQFVALEVALAVANGLISGADKALLIDSLKAEGKYHEYVRLSQHINAANFAATALGVPIAVVLIHYFGISSTLVADGVLTAVGGLFVMRLAEAPIHVAEELDATTTWQATRQLLGNKECRWLVALGVILSSSTYMTAWLSAPYYTSIGIPLAWFSVILAIRSVFKAWLARRFHAEWRLPLLMLGYVVLAGLPYLLMATGAVWLVWIVLGHDIVQALHAPPLEKRYNEHIASRYRAMLNSVVNLQSRLAYAALGPIVGLAVDRMGLIHGLAATGLAFSAAAAVAYTKLYQLGSFQERR